MVDQTSEITPLDQRRTTSFVLDHIKSFSELSGSKVESEHKLARVLADILSVGQLEKMVDVNRSVFVDLFFPREGDISSNGLVVKVVKTRDGGLPNAFDREIDRSRKLPDEELSEVLADESLLVFGHRPERPTLAELTDFERGFAYLAWQHRMHEKLYSPYVLPTVLVSFRAKDDVLSARDYYDKPDVENSPDPTVRQWWREALENDKRNGRMTPDRRYRYVRKGDIVFAVVQDNIGPNDSVFRYKPEALTDQQRKQLGDFYTKVEMVYEESGYFPDSSMSKQGSNNLVFTENGRLVLLDTNYLQRTPDDDYSPYVFLPQIRRLVNG